MPEWWSYSLSDFLLFSPRTYYRLVERYNLAMWPLQFVILGLGLILLALTRRPRVMEGRVISGVLALLWIWVAWAFLWRRYATINWVAVYLLPAFGLQALLLIWAGIVRGRLSFRLQHDLRGVIGAGVFLLAVLGYPALAPLLGRPLAQAEIFGLMPDPTALATLGLLLLNRNGPQWGLLVLPVLWCIISGLTLSAMGSAEALVPPLAALSVVAVAGLRRC